jgi:hypothetical protein
MHATYSAGRFAFEAAETDATDVNVRIPRSAPMTAATRPRSSRCLAAAAIIARAYPAQSALTTSR